MADWNNPTLTTLYTDVLDQLKARDISLAKMFNGVSDTNIPTDTIRWNPTANEFEKWSGSAWARHWPQVKDHLSINESSPGNPHGTTAAMIGAATSAAFNAHVANVTNPHSTTAAQVGAPTTATFNAHANSTTNPHSTTAAQVGALAIASALSELSGVASTARTNIGAASAATLEAHTENESNPHSVTRAQLTAAKSGVNTDITQLNGAEKIGWSSNSTHYNCASSAYHLFNFGGTTRFRINSAGLSFIGGTSQHVGDPTFGFVNAYFSGKLRRNTGVGSWGFFPSQPTAISSLDSELGLEAGFTSTYPLATSLLRAAARGVNQLAKWLIDHGIADGI